MNCLAIFTVLTIPNSLAILNRQTIHTVQSSGNSVNCLTIHSSLNCLTTQPCLTVMNCQTIKTVQRSQSRTNTPNSQSSGNSMNSGNSANFLTIQSFGLNCQTIQSGNLNCQTIQIVLDALTVQSLPALPNSQSILTLPILNRGNRGKSQTIHINLNRWTLQALQALQALPSFPILPSLPFSLSLNPLHSNIDENEKYPRPAIKLAHVD